MPFIEIRPFEDQSTYRVTASHADGRNGSLIIPKRLESSETLGRAVRQLRETANNTAAVASTQIADLSAEGWKKQFPKTVRPLTPPWQQLQGAAVNRNSELDDHRAKLLSSAITIPLNASEGEKLRLTFAHEVRAGQTINWLADKKPSELAAAALSDRELGSLILATPSLRKNLPGDLVERIEAGVIEQTLADQLVGQMPKLKPSYDAPLDNGRDTEAAKHDRRWPGLKRPVMRLPPPKWFFVPPSISLPSLATFRVQKPLGCSTDETPFASTDSYASDFTNHRKWPFADRIGQSVETGAFAMAQSGLSAKLA